MKKNGYDLIYSIGRDCACSGYLIMNKLRAYSGPFDWLTNASFEKRFELMMNDFQDFLNPSDFKFLPKDPNVFNDPKCDYYENIKTDFYYYHDFPAGIPFNETFGDIEEKYNRRIKRFYQKIKSAKKVLLVWFSHYHKTEDSIVLDLCNQFCKKMNKKIDFLIIEHQEGCKTPIKKILSKNITRYYLHTMTFDEKNNPTTHGDIELCNTVFENYYLRLPLALQIKKYFFKVLSKIICPFIFNKASRKKLKQLLREKYL